MEVNKTKFKNRLIFKIFLAVFVFYYFASLYSDSIPRQPFDWDEYNFLKKTYYYDLLVSGNFNDPRWYEGEDSAQPKVGPYLYGIALKLAGYENLDSTLKEIHFNDFVIQNDLWYRTYAWKVIRNYPRDFAPIYDILLIGRVTSSVTFICILFIIFLACFAVRGYVFGLLAVIFVGFSNLFLLMGRMATTDNMLLLFLTANIYLLILFSKSFNKRNKRNLMPISVLIGINAALAAGVKIVGVIAIVMVFAEFLVLDRSQKQALRIKLALQLLVIVITFAAVFLILHPYLYKNTLFNFLYMFHGRVDGSYLDMYKFPTSSVIGISGKIKIILEKTFLPLNEKVATYPILVGLNIYLTLYGLYQLFKNRQKTGEMTLLLWFCVVSVSLLIYLKNNWLRYFQPLTLVLGIIEAYAVAVVFEKLIKKFT